jgi:hypothetical protein
MSTTKRKGEGAGLGGSHPEEEQEIETLSLRFCRATSRESADVRPPEERGEGGEARKPAALSYEAISNAYLIF